MSAPVQTDENGGALVPLDHAPPGGPWGRTMTADTAVHEAGTP